MSNAPELPEGWVLVHADDNTTVIEKIMSGKAVRAVGRDLAHAVADGEALLMRLDEYGSFARSAFGNAVNPAPSSGSSETPVAPKNVGEDPRSEERRVGKEGRSRWA